MIKKYFAFMALIIGVANIVSAQSGKIFGNVKVAGESVDFAYVGIKDLQIGSPSNYKGDYELNNIPFGTYELTASYIGYQSVIKIIEINENQSNQQLDFDLTKEVLQLDDIVITGTKTFKRKTNSPVIVNVIDSKTIDNVQACNLSESLKFQPGLRVETDCQTCNYTQLRMNGLAGGYSQILINGRPIFSPLTGLYGMEQIPANMIDRIEVVRGGGSSLYGSSAIGGTVNIISKIPKENSYSAQYDYQNIGLSTDDHNIRGNATIVSSKKNAGISFFVNNRTRGFYDANGDNFSEIPSIHNKAIGSNLFFIPNDNHKLELNFSTIDEYRLGGEMITDKPPHFTQQSEERTHLVNMASLDYQVNLNNNNSSIITYLAWQKTKRKHYTGISPDKNTPEYDEFLANPPYGDSDVKTYNAGLQVNHKIGKSIFRDNVMTLGLDYVFDDVYDEINAYNYLVDQTTKDLGVFLQSDWAITNKLTLLTGVRMDHHNLVDGLIWSPRASLLYKLWKNSQFRISYGSGFRAPQAFDTDLHIAFAGGGVSRVVLDKNLSQEKSQSYSASYNFDYPTDHWIAGFTIEGFYNQLQDAFYLDAAGEDEYGQLFVKRNGDGAVVKGITAELRANFDKKVQLESGFTLQSSTYSQPVSYIEGVDPINAFIRTPNDYGYSILTLTPNKAWSMTVNYVYTGKMIIPHFGGSPTQLQDEMVTTKSFSELSTKIGYKIPLNKLDSNVEIFGGVKNIFNAYQNDFDIEKNRDSNYIYGPSQPRTFYLGVKLSSM